MPGKISTDRVMEGHTGYLSAVPRALAATLVLLGQPLVAATITVTRFDSHIGTNGECSLPEAIQSANDDQAPSGDCTDGSGADTIVLTNDVILTAVVDYPGIYYGDNGLPVVTSEITLEGNNRVILRQPAAPAFRFFLVYSNGDLTLRKTNLGNGHGVHGGAISSFGKVTLVGSRLSENLAFEGGAIANYSELVLRGTTLDENTATAGSGGGIKNAHRWSRVELFDSLLWANSAAANGGGIVNYEGVVTLVRTSLSDNTALRGGGLYLAGDSLFGEHLVLESKLEGNSADLGGGGVHSFGSELRLIDTTVADNVAQTGAGIFAENSFAHVNELTVTRSTISANRASGGGGGIESASGVVAITNSTLSGNEAQGDTGGGINNHDGTVTLAHSTIMGNLASQNGAGIHNSAGTVTVAGSIIADSTGPNCSGPIVDGFDNFDDDDSCPFVGTVTGADIDSALDDNGGPTRTHALLEGSSARNTVPFCGLWMDQRGGWRDLFACDSGAFEYGADDRYELSGAGISDTVCPGHHIPVGAPEHHLHSWGQADWTWFIPGSGATYELETSNLHGVLSDTWVELWRGCPPPGAGTQLATDDNGGEGNGDKITYGATGEDAALGLNIVVQQLGGFYAPDKGYDLTVTCVDNCPPCSAPGFNLFDLFDETIVSFRPVEACVEIQAGRTGVLSGGTLMLRSGERVELWEGFRVDPGGELVVAIDRSLAGPT